jgi:hypothetical protein
LHTLTVTRLTSLKIISPSYACRITMTTTPNGDRRRTTVYKYYYGFCELTWLPRIPLSSLRFFTGTPVPNDVPGACIIEEIPVGGGC